MYTNSVSAHKLALKRNGKENNGKAASKPHLLKKLFFWHHLA
jgi:hypothetical protein